MNSPRSSGAVGIRQSLPFGVVEQRSRKTDVPSLVLAIESSRMWIIKNRIASGLICRIGA
jgi:hypothetical protein